TRRALLTRLDALELEEQDARRALRAASPRTVAYETPRFAGLAEVEAQLGEREALLSFQVGLDRDLLGEPAGGGWVTVSPHAGPPAPVVPARLRLEAVVPVSLGLFERRDGREGPPSEALFREWLLPALAALPPKVDRLIVVPDDLLHRVPFAALRRPGRGPV